MFWRLRLLKRGGRGGSSGSRTARAVGTPTATAAPTAPAQPAPVPPAAPVAPATNTMVTSDAVANFAALNDSQMAAAINQAVGVGMPNQLSDRPDPTQQLVFSAGINEKPMVLDQKAFDQFMKANGLTQGDLLSRDVDPVSYRNASNTNIKMTAQDVIDMMMYSRVNYIGGKVGGQAYGAGTYFDHKKGRSTGYGGSNSKTAVAVLNPKTTKAINYSTLKGKISTFRRTHPQTARAIDNLVRKTGGRSSESIYALAMGYNVITANAPGSQTGYVNVIDRSALVYRAT